MAMSLGSQNRKRFGSLALPKCYDPSIKSEQWCARYQLGTLSDTVLSEREP